MTSPLPMRHSSLSMLPVAETLQPPGLPGLMRVAELARQEVWTTPGSSRRLDILAAVIGAAIKRAVGQARILYSENRNHSVLATGLDSPSGQAIFAVFSRNRSNVMAATGFHLEGERVLGMFGKLPQPPTYSEESPGYRSSWSWRIQTSHVLDNERRERLPATVRSLSDYALGILIDAALHREEQLVRRAPHRVALQWYHDSLSFLVPCCLSDPGTPDVAAVLEPEKESYRIPTLLPLAWAYTGARVVGPPPPWLSLAA